MTRLRLREYQEDAHRRIAAAEQRGVTRQLGVAATGLGKAQPVDEPVLTPSGWRPIGDLRPGDEVIGSAGRPISVTGVYPQGVRPVVRVLFSDGAAVRCDEDHLWAVRDKHDVYRDRPWRVLRAVDLPGRRWRVPMVEPVEQEQTAPLPLDPYLLGVLLGDGGLSVPGRVLLHTEHELAESLALPAPCTIKKQRDEGAAGRYIIGGPPGRGANPVLSALRLLGLEGAHAHDKRVPAVYLHAGPADRLALLRGLMDADGYVSRDGHVELTLANEGLIADAAALVRSLGGTARTAYKRTSWTHRGVVKRGDAWRLSIALDVCPFTWKADRWKPRTKYHPARHVESVTADGEAECVCIAVDAPDRLYVTTDYVLTHNTIIFTALAEQRGGRTLILAHRDELISQAVAKVLEVWGGDVSITPFVHRAVAGLERRDLLRDREVIPHRADVGIVKAEADDVEARVVVASVQTLARSNRLERLVGAGQFDLVVVDEAHHVTADSYGRILAAVGCGPVIPDEPEFHDQNPEQDHRPLLLGVTATPDRGDGKGLDDAFDEVVFSFDMLWGIRAGYLADMRGVQVKLGGLDLEALKVRRGDYEAGAAGRMLEAADAPRNIVAAWLKHGMGRRTLAFTPTVDLARLLAEAFEHAGVRSAWISGETPTEERREILRRYAGGEIDVLANCAVLTEGYDDPRTDCIIIARPTKSRALYAQMAGRGSRRHPDKADCLVLDVVGVSDNLSLVTLPSLFGLEPERLGEAGERNVSDAVAEYEEEQVAAGLLEARDAELFRQMRSEGIAWVTASDPGTGRRVYLRALPTPRDYRTNEKYAHTVVLLARNDDLDLWATGIRYSNGDSRVLLDAVPLELAQGVGEDAVRKLSRGRDKLMATDAKWRNRRPTPGQIGMAKKWRLTVDPAWNAGELSDRIDARIVVAKARRSSLLALAPLEADGA